MRIAIFGTGGVGGYFGGRLAQTGAAVRLGQAVGVATPLNTFIYNSLLPLELKAKGQVQFTI